MNVLFAMPWDQSVGGVTHVAASLARSLESRGHRAFFVFPGSGWLIRSGTSLQGFPSIECRFRNYPSRDATLRARLSWLSTTITALPQLVRFARAHRIDLINVHYPVSSFALLVDLARQLGVPVVVSAHGSDLLPDAGPHPNGGISRLLDYASSVVVPSRTFLASVIEAYPRVANKARWIYNGYDRRELGVAPGASADGGGAVILCIAAHIHKKGIDVLLEALKACGERRLELRLIGDGAIRPQLEEQAVRLGISDRVSFLGSKHRREVFDELWRCDLLVMPSRLASESFGLAALEAMACGKPVIASAVGGLRELVDDGATGLVVPPDDPAALALALARLAGDPELRLRLGEAGRAKAARFTVEATADEYERLFGRLVGGGPGTGSASISDESMSGPAANWPVSVPDRGPHPVPTPREPAG